MSVKILEAFEDLIAMKDTIERVLRAWQEINEAFGEPPELEALRDDAEDYCRATEELAKARAERDLTRDALLEQMAETGVDRIELPNGKILQRHPSEDERIMQAAESVMRAGEQLRAIMAALDNTTDEKRREFWRIWKAQQNPGDDLFGVELGDIQERSQKKRSNPHENAHLEPSGNISPGADESSAEPAESVTGDSGGLRGRIREVWFWEWPNGNLSHQRHAGRSECEKWGKNLGDEGEPVLFCRADKAVTGDAGAVVGHTVGPITGEYHRTEPETITSDEFVEQLSEALDAEEKVEAALKQAAGESLGDATIRPQRAFGVYCPKCFTANFGFGQKRFIGEYGGNPHYINVPIESMPCSYCGHIIRTPATEIINIETERTRFFHHPEAVFEWLEPLLWEVVEPLAASGMNLKRDSSIWRNLATRVSESIVERFFNKNIVDVLEHEISLKSVPADHGAILGAAFDSQKWAVRNAAGDVVMFLNAANEDEAFEQMPGDLVELGCKVEKCDEQA